MRHVLTVLAVTGALIATPAAAGDKHHRGPAPRDDGNSYWLDYKTDVSEAERELRSDLRDAGDEEDRRDAWEEYRQELADAKQDFRREMRERGYSVGRVYVDDGDD